ncbi:MAG: NUDIX hydrolase [Candidatus Saccharimonadales bacterium]
MNSHVDIYKAGGVIIKDRRFLVTRSVGKDIFIAPGGKLENEETAIEALVREMNEEVQISIDTSTLEVLGSFIAQAAGKEDKTLKMDVFIIHDFEGSIVPSSEVEEVMWVNTQTEDVLLGSIFEHDVMPLLKQRDLID